MPAPFALIVSAYVRTLPAGSHAIAAHLELSLLDLGLARCHHSWRSCAPGMIHVAIMMFTYDRRW